jgi:hypothetical protein
MSLFTYVGLRNLIIFPVSKNIVSYHYLINSLQPTGKGFHVDSAGFMKFL